MGDFVSTISFPGLGIGEFNVDRVAFTIGKLSVTWYGMIICVGIILAFTYFSYRAGKAGINFDSVLDFALFTVPLAILGARLYYVIFNSSSFHSLYDIIAIWEGGLAIYGAIIVGAVVVFCVAKYKKLSFLAIADMATPAVMLGQSIGRWGNFMNGEAFGAETTLPWRMGLCNQLTGFETQYVHPTFLYESLWNLIGFTLINIFYKKKKFDGEIMLWYFTWYGLGRAFIEQLRTDSLYLGNTGIRVSSLLGALCFAVFIPVMIAARIRFKKMAADGRISPLVPTNLAVLLGIAKPAAEAVEAAKEQIYEQNEDEEQATLHAKDLFAQISEIPEEEEPEAPTITFNIINKNDSAEKDGGKEE
jgi:phosphatidylglycerol:prolipoprotein diacylglycerol transferase